MSVLARGKFRGIEFLYETSEVTVGRRTVLTEFPGQDLPFSEDLGRAAQEFTLEMFVLGPAYEDQRRKLIEALEAPGPGTLLHPYYGPVTVTVQGKIRVRETTKELGIARVTATFVKTALGFDVRQVANTAAGVVSAAAKAESSLLAAFAEVFSVLDAISDVADQAIDTINAATSTLNTVRGKISAALQVVDDAATAITQFSDTVADLVALPSQLATDMANLYSTVFSSIDTVTDAVRDAAEFFGADGEDAVPNLGNVLEATTRTDLLARTTEELRTFGDDFEDLPEETSQQRLAAENRRQLVRLVKTATALNAARTAAGLEFEASDQAAVVQTAVVAALDAVLTDDTLPDELYSPLTDLRAATVEHLSSAADALPQLDTYTPPANVPALVLAYQLYADHQREAEILARNPSVSDPTALPGNQPLTVLP